MHSGRYLFGTTTEKQIGTVIDHASVRSVALSPDVDYIVTGEDNGNVTLRNLCGIIPGYLTVNVGNPTRERLVNLTPHIRLHLLLVS